MKRGGGIYILTKSIGALLHYAVDHLITIVKRLVQM